MDLHLLDQLTDLKFRVNIDDLSDSPLQVKLRGFPSSLKSLFLSGNNIHFSEAGVSALNGLKALKFYRIEASKVQASIPQFLTTLWMRSMPPIISSEMTKLRSIQIFDQS